MAATADDDRNDALARAQADVARLQAENARLAELLDMAQEFGRLGVWERDPRTLEGRWDAHVFRFFGFAPGQTPHFSEAAGRVHPDDRLDDDFRSSLHTPGAHARRYRIVRPDGTVAHMHSQWRVVADAAGQPSRVIGVLMDDTESRELAQRMASAHAQLELALSLSGVGLWQFDIASQRVYSDAHSLAMLGRTLGPEGAPVETIRAWIHPDDLAEAQQALQRTIDGGGPVDTQTRCLHADGSWRTLLTRRVLQRDAAGRAVRILGVGLDVTEQQQRTMEALQLARRLDAAAEAANVGLWSGSLDGRLPEWNARMFALLGHDAAEGPLRLGESLRRCTHADDRDRAATQVLAWLHGNAGAQLDIELRIVRPDGTLRWAQVRGRQEIDAEGVHRAFGVMLDITAQREAIERLREAHERVTLALSSVGMGTWSHDVASGRDHWDDQMFLLRGLVPQPRALDPDQRLALVVPEDRAMTAAAAERSLTSPQPQAYEFGIVRAEDGQRRTLASRSIGFTDAQGRVTRRIGVNWDVTETRSVERVQRERELALRESRTKSALFSRISHELRTPLNAVLGFTQLLLAEGDRGDAAQRQRRLLQIQAAGEALLTLVDGVLDLSDQADSQAPPARMPVPLADAVQRALAPLAGAIAARKLRVSCGDLSPVAMADARRVQQLLSQLLGNAVKFNRPRGSLQINARVDGDAVVLGVADSGPGIAADRVARLFEPFDHGADATSPGIGHGIGLAIAQALAQRMGGGIMLARTGSEGSLFELRLPRADAPSTAASTSAAGPALLYIEDNDTNMLIVRELLTQRPRIAFHGASNGASGLALARALKPALVLIDMHLPDMNGMDVMRRLRADEDTGSTLCVALSANAVPEDTRRALAAGFDAYWTKPIDFSEFLRSLDRLLPAA